MKSEGTLSC